MRKEEDNNKPEALLDVLLHNLPDKPVASNFTARVLRAVPFETPAARPGWLEWWRRPAWLLPRVAVAGAAVFLGLFGFRQYDAARHVRMAASVSTVAQVTSLPGPDLLRDFDAVYALSTTPRADNELLALMQ